MQRGTDGRKDSWIEGTALMMHQRGKRISQAAGVVLFAAVAMFFSASERISLGQHYQNVYVNGELVASVPSRMEVKPVLLSIRRDLANQSEGRICMDFSWETVDADAPFVTLWTEKELQDALKTVLQKHIITEKKRAYTVRIGDYRTDFESLAEVADFLEQVKAKADEENHYEADVQTVSMEIDGIMQAGLKERGYNLKTDEGQQTVSGSRQTSVYPAELSAGVSRHMGETLSAASPDSGENVYETGLLGLDFVEDVYVYENYVDASSLCNVKEQVEEVTKEKESNKIYVVESGECLSVIALDQGTTVSSIVALNGLSDADSIRDGQELIISVPEPDLKLLVTQGEVYEEDYTLDPVIIPNDNWYTTKEVVLEEGVTGHRERNDAVTYENGVETSREMIHETVMAPAAAAVIERGTIVPPTYIKPIAGGRFTSGYGPRWGRIHHGVDWACPVGTTVYASSAGTVISASYHRSYGYNVVVSHPDGRLTRYAHCSKLIAKVGDHVEQGDTLALSGNTGNSTGPHVHFEIYINGVTVNPLDYIGQ